MPSEPRIGRVSHWYTTLPEFRAGLPGDRDADVCIVGAGFTGLWTAYYLKRADPSLRITVLEARFAGFGASGRNGGWASALVPGDRRRMAARYGRAGVIAWQRALIESVDELIDVAAREKIDAGVVKGGSLRVARNPAQHERLIAQATEDAEWGRRCQPAHENRSGSACSRRRHAVSVVHAALRAHPAGSAGSWAGLRGRAAGSDDLRTEPRHRDQHGTRRNAFRPRQTRRSSCAPPRASPLRCAGCGGDGCR